MNSTVDPLSPASRARRHVAARWLGLLAAGCACTVLAACAGRTNSTQVQETWKDPKYKGGPLQKIFVLSLMEVRPGGRQAVENALAARLNAAGVPAVAAHTLMPNDAQTPGRTLDEAVRFSGAEGVLVAQVRWMKSQDPYIVGEAVMSPAPNLMGESRYLSAEGANQPYDYKVARIQTDIYLAQGGSLWSAFSDSYDAANLDKNIPDYTLKIVAAMNRDGIIRGGAKP